MGETQITASRANTNTVGVFISDYANIRFTEDQSQYLAVLSCHIPEMCYLLIGIASIRWMREYNID